MNHLEANSSERLYLVLDMPPSFLWYWNLHWITPMGGKRNTPNKSWNLKFPSFTPFAQNNTYIIPKLKNTAAKRVLANLPSAVAKVALPRNTEEAAAIATIIQNRDRLELATPSRLTLPLPLQYRIAKISYIEMPWTSAHSADEYQPLLNWGQTVHCHVRAS